MGKLITSRYQPDRRGRAFPSALSPLSPVPCPGSQPPPWVRFMFYGMNREQQQGIVLAPNTVGRVVAAVNWGYHTFRIDLYWKLTLGINIKRSLRNQKESELSGRGV